MAAGQQACVSGAALEAANERTGKAEAAAIEGMAQARKNGEAVFLEKAKAKVEVEAASNTIADLTGKLDAMQTQIAQQERESDAA